MATKIDARTRTRTPARKTQDARSDVTRRRIIQSAIRLLEKKGSRATSLTDIARGARVTLGALQHHFSSRQVLMERLIDEVMAPLNDDGAVWPNVALPLSERADQFVRSAWDSIYGVPNYVAAWSLFFGCKSSTELFNRIDIHRQRSDPVFFERFLSYFPEVASAHPRPLDFASFVFASLRGLGVFNIFHTEGQSVELQLVVLRDVIVQAASSATRPSSRPT